MIVVLDNIRSLHNVGSIFRTADALGIEKIYLSGITPEPVDRYGRVRKPLAKVSLGAERFVAWEKIRASLSAIKSLKRGGFKIFALEQSLKAVSYFRFKAAENTQWPLTALVVGNEVTGLPLAILKQCDKVLEIPMSGRKESLNVAVAFGVVGFHLKFSVLTKNLPKRAK